MPDTTYNAGLCKNRPPRLHGPAVFLICIFLESATLPGWPIRDQGLGVVLEIEVEYLGSKGSITRVLISDRSVSNPDTCLSWFMELVGCRHSNKILEHKMRGHVTTVESPLKTASVSSEH